MTGVRVEIMSWLNRYFGAEHTGRVVLDREVSPRTTVRDLLEEITSGNQEFREMLFDAQTGRPTGHITLILNGRFLELSGGMEAELKAGDTLRLIPVFSGG